MLSGCTFSSEVPLKDFSQHLVVGNFSALVDVKFHWLQLHYLAERNYIRKLACEISFFNHVPQRYSW